jgi:type I restriction enzyme S subunit
MREPWDIPQIWKWVEIKDIGDIVSGGTPSTKEISYWGNDVNWISPGDLTGYTKKTIARGAKNLTYKGLAKSSARLMPAGSIHFSSRAPIGYVVISSEPLSTNQGFKSLVPAQGVFNEYVYYYLKAAKFIAEERASGTTFREISGAAFGKLPLPFSSLPEQHQIVSKIEELFSELENGIESLKKAREQLKTYRQAVLKYAFEGKLTEGWRVQQIEEGNPPEPAKRLLDRIKQERERHYKKQLEDWEMGCKQAKAQGKKSPPKPKKQKEIPPLTEKELAELPELPEGWMWCRLGQIVNNLKRGPFGSAIKKEYFVPKGIKVYEQKNAIYKSETIGDYFISDEKFKELSGFDVNAGDYIVSCSGTIGRIFRLPENSAKGIINQALLRIRISEELLDHKFFQNLFESSYFQIKILKDTKGSAMVNLAGIKELELVPFAYCSLKEQNAIAQEIESRLSVCDQLEHTIEDSLKKAEALRQSILKKAFAGELTREWRLPAGRQGKNGDVYIVENRSGKLMPKRKEAYFVYVLECEDGSIYKGVTSDLNKRINDHLAGIGAEWTKTHRPIALIHYEEFKSEKEAVEREKYLKSGVGREWLKELQKEKAEQYLSAENLLERIKSEKALITGRKKLRSKKMKKK